MSITSLDGIVAGMYPPVPVVKAAFTGQGAGFTHSSWYLAGTPGAGTLGSPGLAGLTITRTSNGQILEPAAVSGQRIYLAGWDATQSGGVGSVLLLDRIWYNTGTVMTTTTAQTVNSVAFARDANGSSSGLGILVALEVTTATGNVSPVTTITMSYTNSNGVSGNTATIASFPANAVAGTFVTFALAAGSFGVQSIQSLTLGTSLASGAISMVAYSVIGQIGVPVANVTQRQDAIQAGFPVVHDNAVPFLAYVLTGTAGGVVTSNVSFTQG